MTNNDAAAVLEFIVEKWGAKWVVTKWGLDPEQLDRWYSGREVLPPYMVFAMRVWVSALSSLTNAGSFEDSDCPPDVVEEVVQTVWGSVPIPTTAQDANQPDPKTNG
jgi:hypothetical protein